MRITLTLHERFMLESWLPEESKPGELQNDARSLVHKNGMLTLSEVHDRLGKVRKCLSDLRTPRSTLDVWPPLGRGFTSQKPGGTILSELSPWEEAWLIVDRMRSAGRFDEDGASAAEMFAEELDTSIVNAVAIAILCLDAPEEGQRFARAAVATMDSSLPERTWLLWLAGEQCGDLAANLTDELVGETPKKALRAALSKQWSQVEQLLPNNLRKPFPNPIQPSGTRMHGQFLAQLASHILRGAPEREVIDVSLATLFSFYGFGKESAWWDGKEVMTRLPLLALYARETDQASKGTDLLHAQRKVNAHLMEPPQRTFVGTPDVIAALEKIVSALAAAAESGRHLNVLMTEDGIIYGIS